MEPRGANHYYYSVNCVTIAPPQCHLSHHLVWHAHFIFYSVVSFVAVYNLHIDIPQSGPLHTLKISQLTIFIYLIYFYQFLSKTRVAQKVGPANVLPTSTTDNTRHKDYTQIQNNEVNST